MATSSEVPTRVLFRGGFSARGDVVERLLDLERRGARFAIQPDGRIRIAPAGLLDAESRAFLQEHRDEAIRVLQFQADDSHLWDDKGHAQAGHVPPAEVA